MDGQPFDHPSVNLMTIQQMSEADYPSLEAIADAIGVSFGTAKDWAYKELGLRSPFSYTEARKIAAQGIASSKRARGGSKPSAIVNQQKCLEFLGELENGDD